MSLRRRWVLAGACVALLAVLVHLPSLQDGFALDDVRDIQENEAVHGLGRLGDLLLSPYRADIPPARSPYRPVTSASFALSWALGGGSPVVFHALNVGLHAAATAAVLALLALLGASLVWSVAGAALFAVHPVHVEAVANVVGRGDVLAALFVVLGVLVHLATRISGAWKVGGVAVAYALALGSKESAVMLPALLAAVEIFRPEKEGEATEPVPGRLAAAWPTWSALGLVLAAYLGTRYAVLGTLVHRDVAPYIAVLPFGLRLSTAVANLAEIGRLLLVPWELSSDYGPAVLLPAGWTEARTWAGVALVVGAGILAAVGRLRSAWLPLAVLWCALAVTVVANLVIPIGVWVAERTLYLATVGVSFLVVGVGSVLEGSLEAPGRRTLAVAGVAVLALGGWRSWERCSTWSDSETVLRTLAEEHPESYRAQWWVAERLTSEGRPAAALPWFRSALELDPAEANLILGYARALLLAGDPVRAERAARRVPVGLHPARVAYLSQALLEQGREEEAREVVRGGLERFPGDARLRDQAARLGVEEGR